MSTKKKTTENSTTVTTPTNPQFVTDSIRNQMGLIDRYAAADPFKYIAGASPLQSRGFEVVGGLADYAPDQFRAASQSAQQAAGYRPQALSARTVDPTQAFASFGAADPTTALARSLSGSVDNPYLAAMNQAAINQGLQGYQDALDAAGRTLTRQALPSVRSGATLAGQYGGSRQGIAEGLALSDFGAQSARNARDLAQSAFDTGAQLYGGAYESAQDRSSQTANTLAALGLENARANADRTLQADTVNAANGLSAAELNLRGGQASGALGQQALDALAQFGGTQQQLDALYRRAPLDLIQATSGAYGQLPLNLFNGSTQTRDGTVMEKTSGLGHAASVFGSLAGSLGFSPFAGLGLNSLGPLTRIKA